MARDASTSDHLLGDVDADPERPDARSGDDDRPRDDRWGLCYLVFLLAGAGTMFPWNVFITERAYFDVRLFAPPFTPALADSFESVFGVAYLLTNACAQYAMVVTGVANRLSPGAMVTAPLFAMAVLLALTGCVTFARRMSGDATMAITLVTLMTLGVLTALVQAGSFALASVLPPVYNQAIMSGQAVAGIATAVIALLSTAAGSLGDDDSYDDDGARPVGSSDDEANAIAAQAAAYFFTSALAVFGCAASTRFLERIPFYAAAHTSGPTDRGGGRDHGLGSAPSHHRLDSDATTVPLLDPWGDGDGDETTDGEDGEEEEVDGEQMSAGTGGDGRWFYRLAVALTFTVTLCVFPAVTSSVCSAANGASSPPCLPRPERGSSRLLGDLFVPTLFLVFNVGDFCGRAFANVYPRTTTTQPAMGATTTQPATQLATGATTTQLATGPTTGATMIRSATGPAPRGRSVFACALARFALVPPLWACNVVVPGRWRFPRVLAGTDVAPALLVAALAFTNGHLASVCMMYGPSRLATPRERAEEGVKMSFACIAGLGAGSVASFALTALMQS